MICALAASPLRSHIPIIDPGDGSAPDGKAEIWKLAEKPDDGSIETIGGSLSGFLWEFEHLSHATAVFKH